MTAEISKDPWSSFDELLGLEVEEAGDQMIGRVAFYGRCSTEDHQDPETSRGWQVSNAQRFVEPFGGHIVDEFFDMGQSRSVPWGLRPSGARLLAALKDPQRGWSAVVVGEGTRCWFGNQFSLVAPLFDAYAVGLWVPELGGRFDGRNPAHKMLMSVLGGMSESERQHVQLRVRAAMDRQVVNEGRHQGGRAPYGYMVVDGGPHPNPARAADGYRLRVLAVDESAAEVVRRIFTAYLDGKGDCAIARELNCDGIPFPSARHPEQNPYRRADGWQASAVRSILENPRYTGYAVFGRSSRQEVLLDPNNVGAGYVMRLRRSSPTRVVRSRHPAHPAIITVDDFIRAQLLRRSKAAGGRKEASKNERSGRPTKRPYLFRGLIRCGICHRKMEATSRKHFVYYRCLASTLPRNSPVRELHPPSVYLREEPIRNAVNSWLGRLFSSENLDRTIAAITAVQDLSSQTNRSKATAEKRLAQANVRLRRLQAAIEAGAAPVALVDAINKAQAEHSAAQSELDNLYRPHSPTAADVAALIDDLGDINSAFARAQPDSLEKLYTALRLQILYRPGVGAEVTVRPAPLKPWGSTNEELRPICTDRLQNAGRSRGPA